MARTVSTGLLLAAIIVQAASAQELTPLELRRVDAAVRKEMKRTGAVGVAIGLIRNGRIVYLKGYGLADRERGKPVTTRTCFNWASNSKPLMAVAAMQLYESGRLDLDADVRKYVPEFPKKKHTVTVRHLLCHQSGIPHYRNGPVVPTDRCYCRAFPGLDPVVSLDRFNRSPLIYRPGDRTTYSSYAYVLLSAVVQRAGRRASREQIESRISAPLGLRSLQLDMPFPLQDNWAAGYVKRSGRVRRSDEQANYWKHGAGGYKSNIEDFARWAAALLGERLLKKKSKAVMWQVQKLRNGKPTRWGLGFTLTKTGNALTISHNGSQPETRTRLRITPKTKDGFVMLCNSSFVNPLKFEQTVMQALKQ